MFKPFYGYSIADYLLKQFDNHPSDTLVIYEVGAGNGTLMLNILDYIAENRPEIYQKTRYNVIEISSKLAERQNQRLDIRHVAKRHSNSVEIINKSIFDWNTPVNEPCFFLAMEVIVPFPMSDLRIILRMI